MTGQATASPALSSSMPERKDAKESYVKTELFANSVNNREGLGEA
jgi:hypothetical protein